MMKMHLLVFFFLIIGCWAGIEVSVDEKGGYIIHINGRKWLQSSRTALYVDDKWYSSADSSLPLTNITTGQGTDRNLGDWNETCLNYDLVRNETHTKIIASIREWHAISAITFHLDTGDQTLINTVPLHMDEVRTIFPSFNIEKIDNDDARSYFTFEGIMTGNGDKHAGNWTSSSKVIHSGMNSGPLIIFDQKQQGEGDIIVLSPFSRFMATSLTQTKNVLEYGVMGSMISITPNYNHSFIIFYSSKGINEGVREWGKTIQKAYNRTNEYRLNDFSINYLGYYTDNGAYYYYNTEDGKNYEQTMFDVFQKISLPLRYLQIDSWWYYKGIGDGVSNWTARPDIFPNGLPEFHHKLENISIVAHNRYWSYDTIYKENYSFILDEKNRKALPVGNDSFWIDLFTQARQWGLIVYEQDWLITQTKEFEPLYTDIHLGHQWLMSMGEAAEKLNITLQYCMSLPRHILTALEIPRVTQTRVSSDYAVHLENKGDQWSIGISNMFADAIGLAPFKDVFWSTSTEPGANYTPTTQEVLPQREIAIATLSTGPVSPGDSIYYTNSDNVMRCCREDGLIFKPDRPVTMINRLIADWALYDGVSQGELYSASTTINNETFHVIVASGMIRDYLVYPSMIGAQPGFIIKNDPYADGKYFNDTHPLNVSKDDCGSLQVCIWYVAPIWQFHPLQYGFIGEFKKLAGVNKQRITSIIRDDNNNRITITCKGLVGEHIGLAFISAEEGAAIAGCSIFDASGEVRFIIDNGFFSCG